MIKMEFAESLYVELTLSGDIAEIYEVIKHYLEEKEFIFKEETPNTLLKALYIHETLSRNLDVTLQAVTKGILISIMDEFESAKVRGEIFTLRADVNDLIAFLRSKFTQVDP